MRVAIVMVLAALIGCGIDEPVSRTIGARCDLTSECDERCLTGGEYPGGFCSVTCDATDGCPRGAACANDQGGVCLFTCAGDADCTFLGTGWRCQLRDIKPSGQVMVCRGG